VLGRARILELYRQDLSKPKEIWEILLTVAINSMKCLKRPPTV
jgi:hypothetical protein